MEMNKEDFLAMESRIMQAVKGEVGASESRMMDAMKGEVGTSESRIMQAVKGEVGASESRMMQAMKDENRLTVDLLRQEIRATENRIDKKLDAMETHIIDEVADMLGVTVVPQIDDLGEKIENHEKRILILEATQRVS